METNKKVQDVDWSITSEEKIIQPEADVRDINSELNELAIKEAESLNAEYYNIHIDPDPETIKTAKKHWSKDLPDDVAIKGSHYYINKCIDEGKIEANQNFKNHTKWPDKFHKPSKSDHQFQDEAKVMREDEMLATKRKALKEDWQKDVANMHDIMDTWTGLLAKEEEEKAESNLNFEIEQRANELIEERDKNQFLKGLLVFHINVGQLPSDKVDQFVDKIKASCNLGNRVPNEWKVIWLPGRDSPNRIEQILF